jgi:ABC-2 type transport system permease protein
MTPPPYRLALRGQGFEHANGAELPVVGTALPFAFLLAADVGLAILREHGWGTWPRLRASWSRVALARSRFARVTTGAVRDRAPAWTARGGKRGPSTLEAGPDRTQGSGTRHRGRTPW